MSETNPFKNLDESEIRTSPDYFYRVFHWIKLLNYSTVALKDTRDGAYILIIVVKDMPDLLIEFNTSGRVMTFYSNILTELNNLPVEKVHDFLIKSLKMQMNFPTVRLNILEAETLPLRVLSNYRTASINMEFFAELVNEAVDYLNELNDLITEYEFPEIWRETEGEEKKIEDMRKYNVINEYL
jgi:hypothetical protein